MINGNKIKRGGAKRSPSPSPWGVYFIAAGGHLYVKIGVLGEVEEELKNLQERNPFPLKLLGYIPGESYVKTGVSTDIPTEPLFYKGRGWFERSLEMEEFLEWFDEDRIED